MKNFCNVYISSNTDKDFISSLIAEINHSNIFSSYIEENDEFDKFKEKEFPDGFLYFRFLVDIEFNTSDFNESAKCVDELLSQLWVNNISAVASCDFENLLIKNGGYKSNEIPWPK